MSIVHSDMDLAKSVYAVSQARYGMGPEQVSQPGHLPTEGDRSPHSANEQRRSAIPLRLTLVPRSQEALAMLADFGTLLINTDPVLSVARPIAPSLGLGAEPSPPVSQQVIP
jgi:hypothetical protein